MKRAPRRLNPHKVMLADDELLVVAEAFEDERDVVDRLKPAAEAELYNRVCGILLR